MTLRAGERSIKSDPAADIWAIGLIAYELIHRQRAFREFSWTFTDVLDAAAGAKAYPWEDRPGTFRRDPDLRALGSVVRACLARDASARPTAEKLVQKLNQLFDSHGTTMGPGTITSGAEPSVPMPPADELARTGSADMESAEAEAGSEPPAWDTRDTHVARGTAGVRPPPGIIASARTRTYTHSRIELNSLQPSSVLAATAEVPEDGEFASGLRQALAHAWGPSARLETTLEGNEATAETEMTGPATDGSELPAPVAALSLQTSSALVTTADTGGDNWSGGTGGAAGGGGGNPRAPVECAVSASGAESSVAVGMSESNGEG